MPVGWLCVELAEIAETSSGGTPSRTNPGNYNGTIPWIKSGNLKDGTVNEADEFISDLALKNSAAKLFPAGTLLIALYGATIGKLGILTIQAATNQAVCGIFLSQHVSRQFLFSFLIFHRRKLIELGQGGAQPNISQQIVRSIQIPLPPLAEQRRIVAKIEELFSELDAGEESLRRARRQLGVYRQSLLKQAFEGKLSEQWRKQNPDLLESLAADKDIPADELERFSELPASWRYTRLGRFIHHIDAGESFRCEERRPKPDEIGVAKVSAVAWGEYDEAESKTCIDAAKVNPSYFIRDGDFLLSRANTIELVGACVIVRRVTQPIMLSDKTLRMTIDDERKSFLLQYLRSRQGRREIEKRSTGNQESMRNIGQERIRSIVVPECSLPEQREIVRLLDDQFSVIEQNERKIDAALKRSAALRQSILKKAFTGQLVPHDPTDEPASALLERIRKERESGVANAPKKKAAPKRTARHG